MPDAAIISTAALEHLRWAMTPEVGPILFSRLVEYFGSAGAALGAGSRHLTGIQGIGQATAETIARGRDTADVRPEIDLAQTHGVHIICRLDEEYPPGLRQILDAPICLYVRGQLTREDALAIGVVGSRRCTLYGREQARRFGFQLASHRMTVVSGLARGIDGEAHKGALEAGGRTIAVLGNGLATIYPPEHKELAERIAAAGALISELPMRTGPESKNFLPRNRIVAGLSFGVLVIEAARRSGSLTTARLAGEYDREVFALPGRVDSDFSTGTNALIRDGAAKLVIGVEDVLAGLPQHVGDLMLASTPPTPEVPATAPGPLAEHEQAIMNALSPDGCSLEGLAEATGQPAHKIAATLVSLQLRGLARQLPGSVFIRAGGRA